LFKAKQDSLNKNLTGPTCQLIAVVYNAFLCYSQSLNLVFDDASAGKYFKKQLYKLQVLISLTCLWT
jgi:hypothetical protein